MSFQADASQAKSGRACQPCRSRKVKCLPSLRPEICLTCERSGAICEWAERNPRVRKPKLSSKARIAALESKLDELLAGVAIPRGENEHANLAAPSSTQSSFDWDKSSIPTTSQDFDSWEQNVDPPVQEECLAAGDLGLVDVLSQHHLSLEDAKQCLVRFREMTLYFPFIVLPANATLSSLSQESPMLLLAALAAASSSNKESQVLLEKTLRVTLLESVLLNGEKSLDLLAALLVYLAWYHFYCVPKMEASTQLIHLAISMCLDLGLHLRPEEAVAIKIGMNLQHYRKVEEREGEHDEFFSSEARRLLLGCYYFSCSASLMRGKPSTLQYTEYMRECAASLAVENLYPTDSAILPLVQLQHLTERYHEILRRARATMHTPASVAGIKIHLRAVQDQLRAARMSLSPILRHTSFMDLGLHTASIHIHEMDLINPFADKMLCQQIGDSNTPDASLGAHLRLEILLLCLKGAKDFFQSFLTIPASEYRSLSMIQWNALIFATMVLYKLSIGIASIPEWDPEVARNSVPLETYLETCCQLMSTATSDCVPDRCGQGYDLFSLLSPIWRNVKETYLRLRQMPWDEAVKDSGKAHETSFPRMAPLDRSSSLQSSVPHRCPAFSFWSRKASSSSTTASRN